MKNSHLILLAAGQGRRAKQRLPKQFIGIESQISLLELTLENAQRAGKWRDITVVSREQNLKEVTSALRHFPDLNCLITNGGSGRLDSAVRGLETVEPQECEFVMIHDVARPHTPPELMHRVLNALNGSSFDCAWPLTPPGNAIFVSKDGALSRFTDSNLVMVSTPIALKSSVVRNVREAGLVGDGPMVGALLDLDLSWTSVPDSLLNFKVTTANDLSVAHSLGRRIRELEATDEYEIH